MTRARRQGSVSAALVVSLVAQAAHADVHLDVRPVFGEACLPRFEPAELVVTVDNPTAQPWTGTVVVDDAEPPPRRVRTLRAARVEVPGRGRSTVRLSTAAPVVGNDLVVRLLDAHGSVVQRTPLGWTRSTDAAVIDATPGSRLARSLQANTLGDPSGEGAAGGFSVAGGARADRALRALVPCPAERSSETGKIVLPRTPEGYNRVALVLLDTATLVDLGARERQTLADYVLGGGSLALVVTHASDLENDVVAALLGPGVVGGPGSQPPAAPPWMRGNPGFAANAPLPATLVGAVAWQGGHLHHRALTALLPTGADDLFGATADYGAGQVHLLAWNPTRSPALDDTWSTATVGRIAALTAARQSARLFPPAPDTLPVPPEVRAAMTPWSARRPGLGVALGLLLAYGVLAGPITWLLAVRRRPSLRAVVALALWSLAASITLRGVGARSRGDLGRARTLGLVDVAAGCSRGRLRRYHAYSPATRQVLEVRTGTADRTLVADVTSGRGTATFTMGGDASTLAGLVASPTAPTIVREEGFETLDGSVTIVPSDDGGVRVRNLLGRDLEHVVLVMPGGLAGWTFQRLRRGETRDARTGERLSDVALGRLRTEKVRPPGAWGPWGTTPLSPLAGFAPPSGTSEVFGRGLALRDQEAALAVPSTPGVNVPWSVGKLPSVLARVVQPPSAARDGGLKVEGDTLWLRVRGWGGAL